MFGQLEFGLTGTVLGLTFWPRPNKGKFEATGAAGFKASYVVSFTVPYNGGLDPAGTSTKFVSLKFGYQFWDSKSQGQIWTDLAFVFWGTVQAFNVGGCYLGILKGQAYGGPQLSHSSQRYAACFLFTFSSVTLHKGTHPPTSCKCEG